jgi:hypothetical protein
MKLVFGDENPDEEDVIYTPPTMHGQYKRIWAKFYARGENKCGIGSWCCAKGQDALIELQAVEAGTPGAVWAHEQAYGFGYGTIYHQVDESERCSEEGGWYLPPPGTQMLTEVEILQEEVKALEETISRLYMEERRLITLCMTYERMLDKAGIRR